MSERYNVAASAVLGENYLITSIECSDYNPTIDTTITLTITVEDVYGDAVSGESVTVTASEGTFTQLNGSSITAAATVTGTTNSSGQFTLTYACSVWGLITFSANNTLTQIDVGGWVNVIPTHTYGSLWVNEKLRMCEFKYYRTNYNFNSTSEVTFGTGIVPSEYRPATVIACSILDVSIGGVIDTSGNFKAYTSSTGTKNINASAVWHY